MSQSLDLSRAVDRAAEAVVKARHVVALVGAGMSVESGIPPFRGPGGLWTKYGEPSSLGYRQFMDDPALWWARRLEEEKTPGNATYDMKDALDGAKPNPGHYALAEMERMGALKYVITQNVDGLHFRADSVNVAEIHGNRTKLRCLECTLRVDKDDFPVETLPPTCPECAGTMKIDTVMFGEPIPVDVLKVCLGQVDLCDCMLMIGTSGTVHPAAGMPRAAKERGAVVVEINPSPTSLSRLADIMLTGPSGEVLPLLAAKVRDNLGES